MFLKEGLATRLGCCLTLSALPWIVGCGGGDEMARAPQTETAETEPVPDGFETETPPEALELEAIPKALTAPRVARDGEAGKMRALEAPEVSRRSEHREKVNANIATAEFDLGAHLVQVYYATDRLPLSEYYDQFDLATHIVPMVAGLATLLFAAGAVYLRRRVIMSVLTVISAVVTAQLIHTDVLENQKEQRWAENEGRIYGSDRHDTAEGYKLEVGVCEVSIPPNHKVGKIELPVIYRLEFREDPNKHVILNSVTPRAEDKFYDELGSQIRQSPGEQAFVFLHGYNVSFEDAVKRTAQIAHDLRFDGAPICYSWPSKAGLAEYTRDEANVAWTVVHLEDFLNQVVQRTDARTVHLLAHSMGNRALLQALERMALRQNAPNPVFGQLIMAAPDVDAAQFRDRYAPTVARMVRQVTLYASSNDRALAASTKVHGHTRAGLSGSSMVVVPGIDTVDVSPIDTSLIGHSYYGDNPQMIEDLRALVELSRPPSDRPWLERIVNISSLPHWVFRQQTKNTPMRAQGGFGSPQRHPNRIRYPY